MEKVKLAPVGLGRWAKVLTRAARRGDVIEISNCFSRSAEKRGEFQAEFDVPRSAATYDELLADPDLDGILITTPNDTHKPLVLQAAEAGKAVYTDKPISHTLEDAVAIAEGVAEAGVVFAVGHSARRLAGHRMMKRWMDDGTLGEVSLAEANFSNERGLELTPETWRWYASKSPGGAFIQLGVHHADTLQYLLGPVGTVSAHARRLYTKAEVPDAVMAILEFDSGPLGYLGTGWASPGVYRMNLFGTRANLMYDLDFTRWAESHLADRNSTLHSQAIGEIDRQLLDLPATDMFLEQLEEFALAIRGEAVIEVGATEAVRALAVVRAALESSDRAGAAVTLDEVIEAAGAAAVAGRGGIT
jgi:predicted dehydrogenase